MEPRRETWDSFWGQAIRIDFFEGQWDTYRRVADARAEWLDVNLKLDKSKPVLSCACGEGGIELALSRRGFRVTGYDRSATLIHFARDQAAQQGLSTTFLAADLLSDGELPDGNGLVCCFDTLGLFSQEGDKKLLERMQRALGTNGVMIVDSPQRAGLHSSRNWWPIRDGHMLFDASWDPKNAIQTIEPLFIEADGSRVILDDSYDPALPPHTGVLRYIAEPNEMVESVRETGLHARAVKHQRAGYYLVIGSKTPFEGDSSD